MFTNFKLFTEEVDAKLSAGGRAGDTSPNNNTGYAKSGGLTGYGVSFTPKSDEIRDAYRNKKIKKRRFIKNMKELKKDNEV